MAKWNRSHRPQNMKINEFSKSLPDFLAELAKLARDGSGVGVVLFKDGQAHGYQYNLDTEALELCSRIFEEYAHSPEFESIEH